MIRLNIKTNIIRKITKKDKNENIYLYIGFLLNILLLGSFLVNRIPISGNIRNYISSIYFLIIIVLIRFFLPAIHTMGKLKVRSQITGLCIAGSIIYIGIRYGAGLFLKNLASTPYDISPMGIVINLVTWMPGIIASIMVRSYSINAAYKKSTYHRFWIVVITLFLAVLEFNFTKLAVISNFEDLFMFITGDVIPIILNSALLTVICLVGGSVPCIWYVCIIKIFQFIFPFLPELPWIAESVIGITYPIIFSMLTWDEYKIFSHQKSSSQKENIFSFSVFLVVLVAFIWFIIGVFPVYPSVILTGSMEPLIYPGDVVLIQKLTLEEEVYNLKEGDIINFKQDNITITHRIKEIKTDEAGNRSFVTKGDNNDSEDPWTVYANDLKGTIEYVVPKIGLPVLWIHSAEDIPEGVSDY